MEQALGRGQRGRAGRKLLSALAPKLYPGEEVAALSTTNMLRPLCDSVAVTNVRVVAFHSSDVAQAGIKRDVLGNVIGRVDVVDRKFSNNNLVITSPGGDETSFGPIPRADKDMMLGAVRRLAAIGVAVELHGVVAQERGVDLGVEVAWGDVEVIGARLSDTAWRVLKDRCAGGEVPRFVIGAGVSGFFAALQDQVMIAKVNGATGMFMGYVDQSAITSYHFRDIVSIDYNSGLASGVLGVRASTQTDTFWTRHADPSFNPHALPLDREVYERALPRLNELRAAVTEAKAAEATTVSFGVRPPTATAPPAGPSQAADELQKLSQLHAQGILQDEEFQTAKQRILARHGLA